MRSSPNALLLFLENERYAISVILSFLNEVDGTCMLITNKTFKRMLRVFEIPQQLMMKVIPEGGTTNGDKSSNVTTQKESRHLFKPLPVQCPSVLLDRLNTSRLSKRICLMKLWKESQDESPTTNKSGIIAPYQENMSSEEVAWCEWTHERYQFILYGQQRHSKKSNLKLNVSSLYSSKLELLRYRTPPPPNKTAYNFKLQVPKEIFNPIPIPKILPGATVLASYPRSGNTLLRTLLERTTGIVTGSDTRPDRTLSKALSTLHSLVGEGITSHQKTPIIKTHFPERRGYMMYNASRIILLVRNPYDAIDSYWNMCCTNTHTESVTEEIYKTYREKFQGLALAEMGTWAKFLNYWLLKCDTTFVDEDASKLNSNTGTSTYTQKSNSSKGPSILLIRFEDLIQKTEEVLEKVIQFITIDENAADIGEIHPFWKWRIHRALEMDQHGSNPDAKVDTSNLGSYKPRSQHSGEAKLEQDKVRTKKVSSIGKSLSKGRYTDNDLSNMHQVINYHVLHNAKEGNVNLLQLLGYDVFHQKFPMNFETKEDECNWDFIYPDQNRRGEEKGPRSTVRVNKGSELRQTNSPYGRAMTRWRRSQTSDDTKPFEIVSKHK